MSSDGLSNLTLDELRELDRIALKYRGCRYALLTEPEIDSMLNEIRARTKETLDRCVLLEASNVIRAEQIRIIQGEEP